MRRLNSVAIFMFFGTISMLIPSVVAAESVTKPTVTLPNTGDWYLNRDDQYPNAAVGEYDPAGCGRLQYLSGQTASFINIWYESALGTTWSGDQLQLESLAIHDEWRGENYTVWDYDQWTIAGTSVGYTKGYDAEANIYSLVAVLVKNGVYVLFSAHYDWDDEGEVMTIVSSLEVPSTGFPIYLVIVPVAAVAVIVAVVSWRRKKPKEAPKRTTVKFEPVINQTEYKQLQ